MYGIRGDYVKFNLDTASKKLSGLELKIRYDNLLVDVLWFRAMAREGAWTIARHTHSTCEFHDKKGGLPVYFTEERIKRILIELEKYQDPGRIS